MKNLLIVFLAVLIGTGITYSQKKVKKEKVFLGLSVGPSFPESDFANKQYSESSGYAKVGYKIEGYGGVNILGVMGISILGFTNFNEVDPENLKQHVTGLYPNKNWIGTAKSWQLYGGLGGITFYYPLSKTVSADLKIMTGLLSAKSPEISFTSGSNSYKLESATANSFSYLTAIGLNFYVGQNVSLTGSLDFMSAKPNFTNVRNIAVVDGNTIENTQSFYREINVLCLMLGFRYSIR